MIVGFRVSQALHVAAALGIADQLNDGPKSVEDLARSGGVQPDALYRVLRLLAAEGVFAEGAPGHFALTPLAALLRRDVPGSQHAAAIWNGEEMYRATGDLLYSVKSGEPAFDSLFGLPYFEYLARRPEAATSFNAMMDGLTRETSSAVAATYDFSDLSTVVDVGGGQGALIAAVLQANPRTRGILFDTAPAIADAGPVLTSLGVADRCDTVTGDFFEALPEGGDAYVLKWVLHDWDDEDALAILRTCRRAMSGEARLLIVESLIPSGNEPFFAKPLDITMLVLFGGRERTEAEYQSLMEAAGFEPIRVVPTGSPVSVIEGRPAR